LKSVVVANEFKVAKDEKNAFQFSWSKAPSLATVNQSSGAKRTLRWNRISLRSVQDKLELPR